MKNPVDIKALVAAFEQTTLPHMELETDGVRISLTRAVAPVAGVAPAAAANVSAASGPAADVAPAATTTPAAATETVVSDRVGRVVTATSDLPVEGTQVSAGQMLLRLEALKVGYDIVAERDATVVAVHVATGDIVEWGQPLVTIR